MPLDVRTARERLSAVDGYVYRHLISPVREGFAEDIAPSACNAIEYDLRESLERVMHAVSATDRSHVGGVIELIELRSVSPSVLLAQWEDGHPDRRSVTYPPPTGVGEWHVRVYDERGVCWSVFAPTRDDARSAAREQAEAGATTEGEQHGR